MNYLNEENYLSDILSEEQLFELTFNKGKSKDSIKILKVGLTNFEKFTKNPAEVIFPKGMVKGKTDKRIAYLNSEAKEEVEKLCSRYNEEDLIYHAAILYLP